MKRLSIAAMVALVLTGTMLSLPRVKAQQPACLHGQNEAPDQLARRRAALQLARLINATEAAVSVNAMPRTRPAVKKYQPLAQLALGAVPAGFDVQLTTDGTSYAFSLKDTLDPCRFGLFSDQAGLIFAGEVIR